MFAGSSIETRDAVKDRNLRLSFSHLDRTDGLIAFALLAIAAAWFLKYFQRDAVPVEDAAMLLRYAQNLSQGFGIRWNVHQPPVDGATDFLFTVAIGMLARVLHIGVIAASRTLNIAAHLFSVLIVYVGGRILNGNRWVAALMAGYLIIGPALQYCLGCFGAPLFAFLLLCCWLAGLNYALRGASWPAGFAMALLALLAGLTRPEGVLISIILLAAVLYLAPHNPRVPVVIAYILSFGILGGAYFLWHWHYFGYPLPNPYYIKGDGHLYPSSVSQAAANLCNLLAPVLLLLPLGWISPRTRRLATTLTGVLVAFVLMWILLNNWNNAYMRFQYAVVPIVLMTLPAFAEGALSLIDGRRLASTARIPLVSAGLLYMLAIGLYVRRTFPIYQISSAGMRDFAERLRPFADKGYTIVVTEAGTLPLYSEWQTIDGLGLNDRTLAHNGHRLTAEYLDAFHPEVLMVHIDNADPAERYRQEVDGYPVSDGTSWGNMAFINYYGRSHGYTLAAAWGPDACNLHFYWIRPGFPDYNRILFLLRQHPYLFLDSGQVSTDFRNHMDDLHDCEHP